MISLNLKLNGQQLAILAAVARNQWAVLEAAPAATRRSLVRRGLVDYGLGFGWVVTPAGWTAVQLLGLRPW